MSGLPRRILVTGASGFVGRHLTVALSAAFPEATLITPEFDVTDAEAVSDVVRVAEPDTCIHLAAISTPGMALENEDHAWRVNLHGTLHLAHAILRHAPDCQLVFASSADAYGASFRRGSGLDEEAPLAPLNLYTATKAAADLALGSMAQQGLRVVRLRPFNQTGPGQPPGLVVAAFARQVARIAAGLQEPVVNAGNLDPRRDFLDVRDVCGAYVACVLRRAVLAPGVIFNLASGTALRIGDILKDLTALAGVTVEIRIDPTRLRTTDVPLSHGNATKAQELLGWTPSTPWSQTLRDVLDDWRHRITISPEKP
jgi:GDP-4-dehydro-6-deoxy-D-mannose reductase